MGNYSRLLDFSQLLSHRSVFLFGARQTGKSTLLKTRYPDAVIYNLLAADTFRRLSAAPELIRQTLKGDEKVIVIDEIQKLPQLLDEVHLLIEENKNLRFILTGSSARKIRRGGANLLAGRAITVKLHPLMHPEIPEISLDTRLTRGGLPALIDSPIFYDELKAYIGDYLKEEILGEFEARGLESFSRFLPLAARSNGEQVNFTSLGNELGINPKTVAEYFRVLDDTLIGHHLPSLPVKGGRPTMTSPKFFFFDVGIANCLLNRGENGLSLTDKGRALEHLIFLELKACIDYLKLDRSLHYWRTYSKLEVDFVVGEKVAIEVKGRERVIQRDLRGLIALGEDLRLERRIVVCFESARRRTDEGIEIIPVPEFLELLWKGMIF